MRELLLGAMSQRVIPFFAALNPLLKTMADGDII